MRAEPAELCFELHYGCDLADADVLPRLHEVLSQVAPSATLEVHAYERDPARRRVDLGEPARCVPPYWRRAPSAVRRSKSWPKARKTGCGSCSSGM